MGTLPFAHPTVNGNYLLTEALVIDEMNPIGKLVQRGESFRPVRVGECQGRGVIGSAPGQWLALPSPSTPITLILPATGQLIQPGGTRDFIELTLIRD